VLVRGDVCGVTSKVQAALPPSHADPVEHSDNEDEGDEDEGDEGEDEGDEELDEGDEAERLQRTCLDEILARRAEEAAWPAETDVDRLLKAFAVLGRQGVLCLEDSGQDADDLRALADDELQRRRAQGEPLLGWLGSTSTDVRAAAAGHGLLLHVGADDPSGALAVARAAVVALEAAGLDVRWAGRIDEVLRVRLRWLRRMPPGATPLSQH
jgi:hypothetical protein